MLPFLGILVPLGFFVLSKTLKELFGNSCDGFDDDRKISSPKTQQSSDHAVVVHMKSEHVALPQNSAINFTVKCDEDVDTNPFMLKEFSLQVNCQSLAPSLAAAVVGSVDTEPLLLMADTAMKSENKILAMPYDEDVGTDPLTLKEISAISSSDVQAKPFVLKAISSPDLVKANQMLFQSSDPLEAMGCDFNEAGQLLPVSLRPDSAVKSTLIVEWDVKPFMISAISLQAYKMLYQSSGSIEAVRCVDSDPQPTCICKVECTILAVVCDKDIYKLPTLEVTAIFPTDVYACGENLPLTSEVCPAIASDVLAYPVKLQSNDGDRQPLTTPIISSMTVPQKMLSMCVKQGRLVKTWKEDILQLVKICIASLLESSPKTFPQEMLSSSKTPCLENECLLVQTDTKSVLRSVFYMPSAKLSVVCEILTMAHGKSIKQLVPKGPLMLVQDDVSQAWCMGINFEIHVMALGGDNFNCIKTLSASVKLMCLATECHRDVYELHTGPLMVQGVSSILACGEVIQIGTNKAFSMEQSKVYCRQVEFKDCSTLLGNNETSKCLPIMWDDLLAVTGFTLPKEASEHYGTLATVFSKKKLPERRTLKNTYPPSRSTLIGEPVSSCSVFLSLLYLFFCPCFIIIMTFLRYILWAFFGIICCPYKLLRLTLRYFKSLFNQTSDIIHKNLFNTSDLRQIDVGICHSDEEDDFQDCIETELHQTKNNISACDVPSVDSLKEDSPLDQHKEEVVPASSVTFWSSAHDKDATFDIPQECSSSTSTPLEYPTDSQFGSLNIVDASIIFAEPALSLESTKLTTSFVDEVESIGTNSSLLEKELEKQLIESRFLKRQKVKGEPASGAEAPSGNVEADPIITLSQNTREQFHPGRTISPWSTLITIISISFSLCSFHFLSTILLLFSNLFLLPRNILYSVLNSFRCLFCFNHRPPDSTATADVGVLGVSGGEFEAASPSQEHGSVLASADAQPPPPALPQEDESGKMPDYNNMDETVDDSEHATSWSESGAVFFAFLSLCLIHYFTTFLTLLGNLLQVVLKRVACLFCRLFCSLFFHRENQASSVESRTNFATVETENEDRYLDQTMEDSECPAVPISAQSRSSFLPMLCPCCYIFYIVVSCIFDAAYSIFKVLYLRLFRHTQ